MKRAPREYILELIQEYGATEVARILKTTTKRIVDIRDSENHEPLGVKALANLKSEVKFRNMDQPKIKMPEPKPYVKNYDNEELEDLKTGTNRSGVSKGSRGTWTNNGMSWN